MTEAEREDVLNEIVDRELEMFTQAGGREESGLRQPEIFKLTRRIAHSVHGDAFLHSYLSDLRQAERDERNLIAEKQALVNDEIDPLNTSPLLDDVADAEVAFLADAAKLYPGIIKNSGSDAFRKALHAELQTLSPRSLELYAEEIKKAREENRNLALDRHNWLASRLGHPPLANK